VRKLIHNIEALDPEVIVLQEVCEHDWKRLAYLLSKRGYENAPCIGVSPNRSLGFAIFSRLPLRNREAILLSDVDWSPVWPAQSVEFWYQNRWIKLFNIHLIPPHHGQRNEVLPRPCQYMIARDQVEELISMAGQTPAPTIICGDFNQTPASKLMRPFFSRWNDTWTEGGDGFGFTWGTTLPLFRIDYILSPPQLRTVSAKIIKNDFSDHFGLYVVMEIDKK
jgi:endonuclease/exonuclease/phosphatase (EEP) superfamily protein YafD